MATSPIRQQRHRILAALCVLLTLAACGLPRASAGTGRAAYADTPPTPPVSFGSATLVDDQRMEGEPDVRTCGPAAGWSFGNCGQDNPYVSMPWGVSTNTSFLWRSEDAARSFKLVPSNIPPGSPIACPGGGDTDLGVSPDATDQAKDYLNFADMQALTNFSLATSRDGGQTFACNGLSSASTAVDRQWYGFYGDPSKVPTVSPPALSASATVSPAVYLDYDVTAGATSAASCTNNVGGNVFVVEKSTDGGLTYAPPVAVDCNDGIAGNMQVNQQNGHVFAVHTAYKDPANSGAADVVAVNRSTDGGATWTRTVAFTPGAALAGSCAPDCTVGQDFAVLAIDKAGGLYAVWSQASVAMSSTVLGPSHVYYAYSGDEGATWTAERQVDAGARNAATGQPLDVDLFPWVAAGDRGRIDVVWYGTTKAISATSYDSGSQVTDWYPYLAQVTGADTASPAIGAATPVSRRPTHNGGICTMGLGCTTGGDRSLLDFFQVDVDKEGGADVVWADTSNNTGKGANQGALTYEARQVAGPTLFGTTLTGTAPACSALAATPCVADGTGDARYEANGMVGANVLALDITGSSVGVSPTDPLSLDVRMRIADLRALPSAADTAIGPNDKVVDYLTSWTYHVPGDGQDQYDATGNIYYAYLEVDLASGALSAYDGNTCSIATTRGKALAYPGQHAVRYSVDRGAGTIDLSVPRADVGNPPDGAALDSVTAHTIGQAAAAGPYICPRDATDNNRDPSGQFFDVYDKSPAYTALLTNPATGPTNPPSATPEPGSGLLYGAGLAALVGGLLAARRRRHRGADVRRDATGA